MNSVAPKNIRKSILVAALAAAATAAALPPGAVASNNTGVGVGPKAELRYGVVDFQLHDGTGDVTINLKVTARGHVVAKGPISLEDDDSWSGIRTTKYGNSLADTGPIKARVTGSVGSRRLSQPITVYTGNRKWDGTYKASNGLEFQVKHGFGWYLNYGTLAYCTRSHTNDNAFFSLPFDMLPVIIGGDGSFATKGHIGTGKIVKFTGRITKSHRITGYASYTFINIFAGPDPGDYDYCATGTHFHGKRVSKKVSSFK